MNRLLKFPLLLPANLSSSFPVPFPRLLPRSSFPLRFGLSLSLTLSLSLSLFAQELPQADTYPLNFERDTPRTHVTRSLTALVCNGNTLSFTDPTRMYADLTPQCFSVQAGQVVQPAVLYSGNWMQTYIYIDFNRNGRFDVQTPGSQGQLTPDNELVSFAGMDLEDGKYNSAGQSLDNLSAVQPPAFTIPQDLAPGIYMMRWKIDWNNCDPAGRIDEKNSIIQNGGAIADLYLRVTNQTVDDDYQLIFFDEFDQPNGSRPDPAKWHVSSREYSTWNRWISNSPDVAYIQDGNLLCRAIPNPDTGKDNVPMLTGAIETRDLFSFTYGKVEVRLQTNLYPGNFPAAWMMPQPPCQTWPNAGEIDIFESIDAQNIAYHTIHSHWTYDLGNKNDPKSSFSENINVAEWHIYGLEWYPTALFFTVDGNLVATYPRSNDLSKLEEGQWPFDHPFYLILNQSVGNGSWAKEPDTDHIYETRFDYVRVYQKKTHHDAVSSPTSSHLLGRGFSSPLYDLTGRPITHPSPGIYISNRHKILIR